MHKLKPAVPGVGILPIGSSDPVPGDLRSTAASTRPQSTTRAKPAGLGGGDPRRSSQGATSLARRKLTTAIPTVIEAAGDAIIRAVSPDYSGTPQLQRERCDVDDARASYREAVAATNVAFERLDELDDLRDQRGKLTEQYSRLLDERTRLNQAFGSLGEDLQSEAMTRMRALSIEMLEASNKMEYVRSNLLPIEDLRQSLIQAIRNMVGVEERHARKAIESLDRLIAAEAKGRKTRPAGSTTMDVGFDANSLARSKLTAQALVLADKVVADAWKPSETLEGESTGLKEYSGVHAHLSKLSDIQEESE